MKARAALAALLLLTGCVGNPPPTSAPSLSSVIAYSGATSQGNEAVFFCLQSGGNAVCALGLWAASGDQLLNLNGPLVSHEVEGGMATCALVEYGTAAGKKVHLGDDFFGREVCVRYTKGPEPETVVFFDGELDVWLDRDREIEARIWRKW